MNEMNIRRAWKVQWSWTRAGVGNQAGTWNRGVRTADARNESDPRRLPWLYRVANWTLYHRDESDAKCGPWEPLP